MHRSAFPAQRSAATRLQRSAAQCDGSRLRRYSASEREWLGAAVDVLGQQVGDEHTELGPPALRRAAREREQTFATVKGSGQHHQRLRASGHAMHKRLPLRLREQLWAVLFLCGQPRPPAGRAGLPPTGGRGCHPQAGGSTHSEKTPESDLSSRLSSETIGAAALSTCAPKAAATQR